MSRILCLKPTFFVLRIHHGGRDVTRNSYHKCRYLLTAAIWHVALALHTNLSIKVLHSLKSLFPSEQILICITMATPTKDGSSCSAAKCSDQYYRIPLEWSYSKSIVIAYDMLPNKDPIAQWDVAYLTAVNNLLEAFLECSDWSTIRSNSGQNCWVSGA